MKKIFATFAACTLLVLNSAVVFGWGPKGHDIVAAIAEKHLSDKTKTALAEMFDGHSIVYYSSWMDGIQNSPEWTTKYSHTKTWHYANVDKGETYQTMKKNDKGDVVTALTTMTATLKTYYPDNLYRISEDDIKMIVHMVGDMHCPMHAGRLSDLGGNKMKVRWFGRNTNLHSVWDSKMIDSARTWSYSEWCEHLDVLDPEHVQMYWAGNFEEWFMETVGNAAKIYEYVENLEEENPNLSYQFIYDFSPMLEDRLVVAGIRLAYVLNSIFDPEANVTFAELAEKFYTE